MRDLNVKPLSSVKRLSGLYKEALPADDHVHIVIRRPPNGVLLTLATSIPQIIRAIYHSPVTPDTQLITLNCWVFADDPDRVFPVDIDPGKSVGALKEAIKEENPDLGPARTLDLWKASARIG